MDNLVASGPENGGSEDLLVLGVDQQLHEALGFALFDRPGDPRHRACADQRAFPAAAHLLLGQTGPAERRVGIERIGRDAVAEPARIVVEQIGRDDLEIVIGGVGKGAPAVAVAERPDPRHIGAQLIVDDDIAVLVLS